MKRKNLLFQLLLIIVLLSFSATMAMGQSCGDVNEDGSTDIVDALLIAQCYVGLTTCPDAAIGDVNCDENIDIVDALLVAQFYVGTATLECCETETPTPVPETPEPTEAPTSEPGELLDCSELREWDADTIYGDSENAHVQYNGYVYENQWWTQGDNPEENSGEYDVWQLIGQCDPDLTPTPSPSPSPCFSWWP